MSPLGIGAAALGVFYVLVALLSPGFLSTPQWDETFYVEIARDGYAPTTEHLETSPVVFSPGYPMLLRGFAVLTGMSVETMRLALSGGLFLLSCFLLSELLGLVVPREATRRKTLASFVLLPGSLYFMIGYAEALYLPLALGFFLCLIRGQRTWACVCVAAALFTRSPAIVLAMTLGVTTVCDAVASPDLRTATRKLLRLGLWELPICATGVLAYMGVLWAQTGEPLVFLDGYAAWNHLVPLDWCVSSIPVDVRAASRQHPGLLLGLAMFYLCPLLLLWQRRALPFALFVFGIVSWLFFLKHYNPYRAPLGNWVRWTAVLFPVALAFALGTEARWCRKVRLFELGTICLAGMFVCACWLFLTGRWLS